MLPALTVGLIPSSSDYVVAYVQLHIAGAVWPRLWQAKVG